VVAGFTCLGRIRSKFTGSVKSLSVTGQGMAIYAGNRTSPFLVATDTAQMIGSFQPWLVKMECLAILELGIDSFR
jgi:hypothetical protein